MGNINLVVIGPINTRATIFVNHRIVLRILKIAQDVTVGLPPSSPREGGHDLVMVDCWIWNLFCRTWGLGSTPRH